MSGEEYLLSLLNINPEPSSAEGVYINQRDCPFIKYYHDRLTVKYQGKGLAYSDITSVQSNKPANRNSMIYYFEIKVNDSGHRGDLSIGLANEDFPLNKHPGWTKKSYGYQADGKVYNKKQVASVTMPKFSTGDYVGCGINYFKKEIFFTYNGEYSGPVFKDIELKEYFATVGLRSVNECVTFNFGKVPFKFNLQKLILDEKRENVKGILKQPINHYSLHQIVHSYLNFHGYARTLEAFERSAQIERRDVGLPRKEVFDEVEPGKGIQIEEDMGDEETRSRLLRSRTGEEGTEMEIETTKKDSEHPNLHNGHNGFHNPNRMEQERLRSDSFRFRSDSLRIEFESPGFEMMRDQLEREVEPFSLNNDSNTMDRDFNLFKKASMHIEFNNNSNTFNSNSMQTEAPLGSHFHANGEEHSLFRNQKEARHNTYMLHERAHLRELLLQGEVVEAINTIGKLFPNLLEEKRELLKILHTQQFIEYIKQKDFLQAISFSQKNLVCYNKENIYCLNKNKIAEETPINAVMALLCYPEPETSEVGHFLSIEQRDLVADIVNKAILREMGFIDKSILDILIAQVTTTEKVHRENNSYYGEVFEFRV